MSPDAIALAAVAVLYLANALGLLERLGVRRTAADAAAELDIANRTIDRLRKERNQEHDRAQQLESTHSLTPVLAQLEAHATLQQQVLDRLVHHNGSFAHMEASMKELVESLKLLTGFIAGIVELPPKPH